MKSSAIHAVDTDPSDSGAGATDGAQNGRDSDSQSVVPVTRKSHNAWRAAREMGARVLYESLKQRHGSVAAWARKLGVDPTVISRWTLTELAKSPEVADVLLMQREDAVRFLRALLRALEPDAQANVTDDSRSIVVLAARILDRAGEAMRDHVLSPSERNELADLGDELAAFARKLSALRVGGGR